MGKYGFWIRLVQFTLSAVGCEPRQLRAATGRFRLAQCWCWSGGRWRARGDHAVVELRGKVS